MTRGLIRLRRGSIFSCCISQINASYPKITDPLGNDTVYTYNNRNWLIKTTYADPDGAGSLTAPETTYGYDAVGNLTSVTDPLSKTTDYTFDNLYRLISTKLPDPDGAGSLGRPETTYEYDAVGNLTKLTDPESNATTWAYDDLDRVTSETNALSDARSYTYDAVGNVMWVTPLLGEPATPGASSEPS